jgi:hypothetical protein
VVGRPGGRRRPLTPGRLTAGSLYIPITTRKALTMPSFAQPDPVSDCRPADVEGDLLVLYVRGTTAVENNYGLRTCLIVDVLDVETDEAFPNSQWFGQQLVAALGNHAGEIFIGVIGKGKARGDRTPPWTFESQAGNATAVRRAEELLKKHPEFGASEAVSR